MTDLQIDNLVKDWGATRAVDDVSFLARAGTLTVLLGPSGCGKSTILRMVAGLESVEEGKIWIDGQEVTREDPARRGVSMVFQSYALFPHLNVRENILFGLKVRRVTAAEREKRLKEAAAMVGLQELLGRKPSQLSGGQRQRVALARTIVSKQPICLMDEPLSNLDAKLRAEMRDEIQLLQRSLNLDLDKDGSTSIFIGDSPNDAPMFESFEHSVGVANIRAFESQLMTPPRYVTHGDGGMGFVEFSELLINARGGSEV